MEYKKAQGSVVRFGSLCYRRVRIGLEPDDAEQEGHRFGNSLYGVSYGLSAIYRS